VPRSLFLTFLVVAVGASAQPAPEASPPAVLAPAGTDADPVFQPLLSEVLARSPERFRAEADVAAEQERVPQVGALPDPTLVLGIQNDGFKSIQIGTAETSFWQVLLTFPLTWPGKPGLREDVATAQVAVAQAGLQRVQLSLSGEAGRAFVDLLLTRGELELQERLEGLWTQAEQIARTRYALGSVPQSDLLRAQLEQTRLQLQRINLETTERTQLQELNRLRQQPLETPLPTPGRLADLRWPALPSAEALLADAEARSPDLAGARRNTVVAERRVTSAYRERWPDVSLTAAIMPRGSLEPMWAASLGISLPLYWGQKQGRAVTEREQERTAAQRSAETVQQLVELRTRERQVMLEAALRKIRLYREGLLIQSDAAVRSTLAQYQVGKVPFTAVLEVMRGLVNDEGGYLSAIAETERLFIALREVSLEPSRGSGGEGGAGSAVPGATGWSAAGRGKGAASGVTAQAPSAGM
jgi:outer membrane protein, heavy metal efflux system